MNRLTRIGSRATTKVRRGDSERLAVLGDGPAGEREAARLHRPHEVGVGKGSFGVLRRDEISEQLLGRIGGPEELIEGGRLAGGQLRPFSGDGAADGRFMKPQGCGDLAAGERLEVEGAAPQESLLLLGE